MSPPATICSGTSCHLRFETEAGLRMHRCEVALRVSRAMKMKLKIVLQVGYESISEDYINGPRPDGVMI